MIVTLPPAALDCMQSMKTAGYEIYAVGGSVRDLLLDRPSKDWDFTTNATPEQILEVFPHGFYNNQFGTVGVPHQMIDETEAVFEITTYRTESGYGNKRHPEQVAWSSKLEDDLARRDFTINAIAYDGKEFADPYEGKQDIKNKIIRAVGEPDVRFTEDALRLMRAVRLSAQLGFTIEINTHESIKRNARHILEISAERVRDELLKLIVTDHASAGIMTLRETGLLPYILPELDACFAIDQKSPQRHHIYDVGTHLVKALEHCPSRDPITRLATLLHDIGKVQTYRRDPVTNIATFYNHEVVGAHQVEQIALRLKLSKKETNKLVTLVRHHQFTVTEDQSDKAIRRFIRDVSLEYVQDMLDLRTGDRIGSGARETSWRTELFKKRIEQVQVIPFAVKDLKIDGHDVMTELGIKPSRRIGEILEAIFEKVENEQIPNEREALVPLIKQLA